jgi:hypothetical protein
MSQQDKGKQSIENYKQKHSKIQNNRNNREESASGQKAGFVLLRLLPGIKNHRLKKKIQSLDFAKTEIGYSQIDIL